MTTVISPREAARDWIADTLTSHLHRDLQPRDRESIRRVAEAVELETWQRNMPVEMAIELAVEWCEMQNVSKG